MPFALLLIPLFAWADRTVGGAGRRSIAFGAVALLGAFLWVAAKQPGAGMLCGVWILYRSLPWRVWGTATPHGAQQVVGSLLRHAIPAVGALVLALGGYGPVESFYGLVLYAVSSAALAVNYASHIDALRFRPDAGATADKLNALQEYARGALFGAAMLIPFLFSETP